MWKSTKAVAILIQNRPIRANFHFHDGFLHGHCIIKIPLTIKELLESDHHGIDNLALGFQLSTNIARAVDSGLVLLCWSMGHRIRMDVLKEKRAEYGQKILHALSAKLVAEFGKGYSVRNLANMIRFAEVFPSLPILQSLIAKLSWTHFLHIIYLDDSLIIHARRSITPAMSVRFGAFFGQSQEFWQGIQVECDFRALAKDRQKLTAPIQPATTTARAS